MKKISERFTYFISYMYTSTLPSSDISVGSTILRNFESKINSDNISEAFAFIKGIIINDIEKKLPDSAKVTDFVIFNYQLVE